MTARFLSIRPSRPDVQAERDRSVREAREQRKLRQLRKATHKAATASAATASTADLVSFVRWYGQFTASGIVQGLSEAEEARVRDAAWAAYHGGPAELAVWMKAIRLLQARHREAGELMRQKDQGRMRSQLRGSGSSTPQGW